MDFPTLEELEQASQRKEILFRKCKILECQNQAQGNFPCCSQEHGTQFRMRKSNIKEAFDADAAHDYASRNLYSIEEVIYYQSL